MLVLQPLQCLLRLVRFSFGCCRVLDGALHSRVLFIEARLQLLSLCSIPCELAELDLRLAQPRSGLFSCNTVCIGLLLGLFQLGLERGDPCCSAARVFELLLR